MKLSEMINALKESKEMYGDIDVEILIQTKDCLNSIEPNEPVYFNYGQYEDGDRLGIQNFPY